MGCEYLSGKRECVRGERETVFESERTKTFSIGQTMLLVGFFFCFGQMNEKKKWKSNNKSIDCIEQWK